MAISVVAALLVGVALGAMFRVWILLPASLGLIALAAFSLASILDVVVGMFLLQVGYMLGLGVTGMLVSRKRERSVSRHNMGAAELN